MTETINKLLDFAFSDAGQALITAVVGILALKYGQHFKITPKQVETVLSKASEFKKPGQPLDTKELTKEIQRDIRKNLFK